MASNASSVFTAAAAAAAPATPVSVFIAVCPGAPSKGAEEHSVGAAELSDPVANLAGAFEAAAVAETVLHRTPFEKKILAMMYSAYEASTDAGKPLPEAGPHHVLITTTLSQLRRGLPVGDAIVSDLMRTNLVVPENIHVVPDADCSPDETNLRAFSEAQLTKLCLSTDRSKKSFIDATNNVCRKANISELKEGDYVLAAPVGSADTTFSVFHYADGKLVLVDIKPVSTHFGALPPKEGTTKGATAENAADLVSRLNDMTQRLKTPENRVFVLFNGALGYSLRYSLPDGAPIGSVQLTPGTPLSDEVLFSKGITCPDGTKVRPGPIGGLRFLENELLHAAGFIPILVGRHGADHHPENESLYHIDSSIACAIALKIQELTPKEQALFPRWIIDIGNNRAQVFDRVLGRIVAKSENYDVSSLDKPDLQPQA